MNDDLELQQAGFARPMTRDELRAWLDRKPPPWQLARLRRAEAHSTGEPVQHLYEKIEVTPPDIRSPEFFGWVDRIRQEREAAEPWTLVQIPPGQELWVAKKRSLWMMLYTAWLNIFRRKLAKQRRAEIAARAERHAALVLAGKHLDDGTAP